MSCTLVNTSDIFPCTGQDTINLHAKVAANPLGTNTYAVFEARDPVFPTANVTLVVAPSGAGALTTSIPDGTATGGNNRGLNAVDLQRSRTVATQVASGNFSVIGGGQNNLASGTSSTVGGGTGNTASGDFSTIPGGLANVASGLNSFASGTGALALNRDTFVWGAGPGPTSTSNRNQVIFNLTGTPFQDLSMPVNTFIINGDLQVTGSITAQTKNFTIDHPVLENKYLRYTCAESPKADLIYKGTVQLVNGKADVDLDITSNMTATTFSKLTKNSQVYLTNRTNPDWVKVEDYNTLSTGKFVIVSNDSESNATIDWLVIAERDGIETKVEIDK